MPVARVNKLLRRDLRELSAYAVQAGAGMVKLDAMENPYALPSELQQEWLKALSGASLNRYPDAAAAELKQSIKNAMQLPQNLDLILGNGSDELIQLLYLAVIDTPARKSGKPTVMAPEPGFAMYRQTAVATGLNYVGVPLLADSFDLDMPAMLNALERYRPELLFLAYPNNPTGNLFKWSDLQQLIEHAPGLVIFDEAYHPFAGHSAVSAAIEHDHVLLLRTFSKLGLAGIRLGLLAGSINWLQHFEKLRLPYNINVLTQLTAKFACRHYNAFLQQSAQILRQRKWLSGELDKITALKVYDSRANFILFRLLDKPAENVFRELLGRGVLIKNMDRSHPMLKDCMRVTVGTEGENKTFLAALKQSL